MASQLKPRKGKDIILILIESMYSLFWKNFCMRRVRFLQRQIKQILKVRYVNFDLYQNSQNS